MDENTLFQNFKNQSLLKVHPEVDSRMKHPIVSNALLPQHAVEKGTSHSTGIMSASFHGIPLLDTGLAAAVAFVASEKLGYNPVLVFAGSYILMRGAMLATGSIDSAHFFLN
jgi:hypothetical protein